MKHTLHAVQASASKRLKALCSEDYLSEYEDADDVAKALTAKTGIKVKGIDYATWLDPDFDSGDEAKFDKAVKKLLSKAAYAEGDSLARLDALLRFALGLGPDRVGGISMKALLVKYPK